MKHWKSLDAETVLITLLKTALEVYRNVVVLGC